jgi:hypothetical protein
MRRSVHCSKERLDCAYLSKPSSHVVFAVTPSDICSSGAGHCALSVAGVEPLPDVRIQASMKFPRYRCESAANGTPRQASLVMGCSEPYDSPEHWLMMYSVFPYEERTYPCSCRLPHEAYRSLGATMASDAVV